MTTATQSKVSRIFEYLLAVKNMNERTIYNIGDYEKHWWQTELPDTEGCFLGGTGEVEEAWLEVHKQRIMEAPAPPKSLHHWISDWKNPVLHPEKVVSRSRGIDRENDQEIFEKFEDDEKRVADYEEWYEERWLPWARETAPKNEIQKIYDYLFTLHQQLQREGEDLEIAWGHGLFNWEINGLKIRRHLLVTALELQFNAKKGMFTLSPTSKGTELETDMLPAEEVPNMARINEMEQQVKESDIHVWNEESIRPFLREVVHTISSKGYYSMENEVPEQLKDPVITYTPALFLRKSSGRIWQKELETAIEKINNGYSVPTPIKQLAISSDNEAFSEGREEISAEQWPAVGEQLLFPLATNNEQKLIAKKLAYHDGVLVQGPPGTGKSHTIANLISHLLAHGKRVLVTSEKGRALEVLRDKIPEEIRSLCVSVLGGDSRSVKEIEDSIKFIAESLDSQQPETLQQEIERLKTELDQTKRNIAKINYQINQTAEREHTPIKLGGEEFTPLTASKWLADYRTFNFIPDNISLEAEFPFNEEEWKEFFNLHGRINRKDRKMLEKNILITDEIMQPEDFTANVTEFQSLKAELAEYESIVFNWNKEAEFKFSVQEKAMEFEKVTGQLQEIKEDKWRNLLLKEMLQYESRKERWQGFYEQMYQEVTLIDELRQKLIVDDIKLPDENLTVLREDLEVIKGRLENNKSIGWMFKNILGRKYTYIFEGCKINGLEIRNKEDVDKVLAYIKLKTTTQQLVLRWNRMLEEYEGPQLDEYQRRLTTTLKRLLDQIEQIIQWEDKVTHAYAPIKKAVFIPRKAVWDQLEWFNYLTSGLTALHHQEQLDRIQAAFDENEALIKETIAKAGNLDLIDKLWKACQEKDAALWKKAWNELKRLEKLNETYLHYNKLREKLARVTPLWLNELDQSGGEGNPLVPPENTKEAWKWSQLNYWLKKMKQETTMDQLNEELQLEFKNESKLIKQLVTASTWKSQIERTTREQKRSLFAWLNNIKRIGKGTGKYASAYRKEASKEMSTARGAIPVWIMPIRSVIENFDLNTEQFDVVIVDESSQSDLFSLSALLRGKKAVVVGDDQQISPESVGTDISKVHGLIERYLNDIPNRLQFEMKTSLYDTASRIFDSKIILREHFRSVPEIIQFSNDLMYGGMIDPLRLPIGKAVLDPPVKAVRVPDGYRKEDTRKAINEPEAEAIVEKIKRMVEDDKYKDKSIGVISLQGHDQARLIENLLREVIGEEEMIKRQIISGDSYSFQGDERDVILMSMVVAPNLRIGTMTRDSDFQRFNVAASRARDQMILFHSVELGDLNPQCTRYRLLEYCKNPQRVQLEVDEVKEEFDSQFEEEVFRLIKARGYRVVPQVQVGTLGKKIDLVVEGMRNRLAIECDGDRWHGLDKWEEDMERQRILERVGWTFWRIRGSEFYLNRERALDPLWRKLEEMEIEPVG
ncbi:AAA domain-containing protein [Virgibacillus kimchii]